MKVSPPKSFIHTADFPSPKALAQVLVMVSVIVIIFLIMSSFGSYTKYISWGEGVKNLNYLLPVSAVP